MAYFTFDTAWIVAHMQNSNNEAVKEAIRNRLDDQRAHYDGARYNREAFEQFCWAWKNGCITPERDPPAVDPFPYLETPGERNPFAGFHDFR